MRKNRTVLPSMQDNRQLVYLATRSGKPYEILLSPGYPVRPEGKTDEQIAEEGLEAMEKWMREIGLVMNLRDLGVTDDMTEGLADATFIMTGGYKVLTRDDVINIFKKSM